MTDKSAEHRNAMDEKLVREGKGNLEQNMTEISREMLRDAGWSVAVHNDYRQDGKTYTFWLFTHPSGRWVKGEGETDADAITNAAESALEQPAEGVECGELMPCPFCGGKAEVHHITEEDEPNNAGGVCVCCKQCAASSRVHFSVKEDGEPHAISAWNRRSNPAPPEGPHWHERCAGFVDQNNPVDVAWNALNAPPEGELPTREQVEDAYHDNDDGPLQTIIDAALTYKERLDRQLQGGRQLEALRKVDRRMIERQSEELVDAKDRITALEAQVKELEGEREWNMDMSAAPRDHRVIEVVGRYVNATAGAPKYVQWQGEDQKGEWRELNNYGGATIIPWAWRERTFWPHEPDTRNAPDQVKGVEDA